VQFTYRETVRQVRGRSVSIKHRLGN